MNGPLVVFAGIGLSEDSRLQKDVRNATCYGFQIFVALVQAGVAIAASTMSCRILCCSKQDNAGGVVYLPGPNPPQQFMMVATNQFSNPQQFVTAPSNQVASFTPVCNGNISYWI